MANKETVRKLPLIKMVNEDNKKFDETMSIEFYIDGKRYEVKLTPFFAKERIDQCVQELVKSVKQAEDEGIELSDGLFFPLVHAEIIREFTDLTFPKNPKQNIQFFMKLYNSRYYDEIMEMMLEDEIAKVYEKVFKMIETNGKIEKQFKTMQDEVKNLDIKTPELKQHLQEQVKIDSNE
ncbi:hypothetical protein JOC34_000444 [Virgibacillus halotolerans]|uniref:hypothetical protein n=1 Tax=Virgibacillus halotolerans TaxID=1071053 RepID=UPI001960F0CB|nr:hypothetical protein [Virgibacillus halotolerans]MBM7598087.1 hypothetical protein [Virgibacillus halotolerans]